MIPVRIDKSQKIGEIVSEIEHLDSRHSVVLEECPVCGDPLGSIEKICLIYVGAPKEKREQAVFTGGAVAVHSGCIK